MPSPPPPSTLAELAALRAHYTEQPDRAHTLLAPVQAQLQPLLEADRESEFGVELGLLFIELCLETRRYSQGWAALAQLVNWNLRGAAPHRQALLQALHARALVAQGRLDEALPEIERALQLAQLGEEVLAWGYAHMALGHFAARQGDGVRAAEHLREALALLQRSGNDGPWAHVYAALIVALRNLASPAERLAVIHEGKQVLLAQCRWAEACNLTCEQIEIALSAQRLDEARAYLREAEHLARQAPPQAPVRAGLQLANSSLLFAEGAHEAAIALAKDWLASVREQLQPVDQVFFLERLARWQAQAGQAQEALDSLAESHRVALAAQRAHGEGDLRAARQALELAHERQRRAQSEAHATELARTNRRLQRALDDLSATQRQLLDAAKHAALGRMLAGMAHEINTPVGNALTTASALEQLAAELPRALQGGQLRRSELERQLQTLHEGSRLVVTSLTRASELLGGFRDLPTLTRQEAGEPVDLPALVRAAAQRSLPDTIRLQLAVPERARLDGEALLEVLQQLLQNTARHAYPQGQPGTVAVDAQFERPGWLRLSVQDQGPGVPAELLPQLFEPYATSRFGQGRSGLGLFVSRAIVEQRLGGRIELHSQPGRGCRVELALPAPA